jgi:hypothetical protein
MQGNVGFNAFYCRVCCRKLFLRMPFLFFLIPEIGGFQIFPCNELLRGNLLRGILSAKSPAQKNPDEAILSCFAGEYQAARFFRIASK